MQAVNKFKVIECRGTPYDIGYQWGEGCKASILQISENIYSAMASFYQASKEAVLFNAMKYFPIVQAFDPYLVEIMRGQADAAGLSLEEIITQKCFNELTFYYNTTIIPIPSAAMLILPSQYHR